MNSSDRAEPVDNTAAQQPSAAQADVRANSTATFANLTHLPHLPHLPKSSSGYELHPTSSTSTRATATVDGSIRPIEDTRPLRSVDAIRSDLEHPHTAALTALHSTTIGDGPIGRLLRDVAPLLDRATQSPTPTGPERCDECDGTGTVYLDSDGDECSETDRRDEVACPHCSGPATPEPTEETL